MNVNIGDIARLVSYPLIVGKVGWINPVEDADGRTVHLLCGNETYRLNMDSLEVVAAVVEWPQ